MNVKAQSISTCSWCGKEIETGGRGRPRKFCRPACRQRAYEQRLKVAGTGIPEEAVIIQPEKVRALEDQLFELRCAAEDIKTAVSEGAGEEDLLTLCDELLSLARRLEKMR